MYPGKRRKKQERRIERKRGDREESSGPDVFILTAVFLYFFLAQEIEDELSPREPTKRTKKS